MDADAVMANMKRPPKIDRYIRWEFSNEVSEVIIPIAWKSKDQHRLWR